MDAGLRVSGLSNGVVLLCASGVYKKNRGVKQKSALWLRYSAYTKVDTLISPIVASYLLDLVISHTLIRPNLDKSDNLHFNGDYRKMLICSHFYLGIYV